MEVCSRLGAAPTWIYQGSNKIRARRHRRGLFIFFEIRKHVINTSHADKHIGHPRKSGCRLKLAKAIAEAIDRELDARKDTLATKNDLLVLESNLIKWVFAFFISQTLIVLGAMWFMVSSHTK